MQMKIDILSTEQHAAQADAQVLQLSNDVDPLEVSLDGVARIELNFPKFTDGRAYSQAYLLRQRRKFAGDIRATGDVLIDQLVRMQRTGFSSAVLKDGKDPQDAVRQFERFAQYYQGDVGSKPHFAKAA
jgi:uncharacterized protein (DUF934 family)